MNKQCFKCLEVKPLSCFYKHKMMADGHLNKCKDCTKKDVTAHRLANLEKVRAYDRGRSKTERRKTHLTENTRRWRERVGRVHAMVEKAVRSGRLMEQPCEVCGDDKVEAHHDDYSKPLDVRWLCFFHHRQHHGQFSTETKADYMAKVAAREDGDKNPNTAPTVNLD